MSHAISAGLTDTFIKNTKHSGKPAGDKHADGGGMYLHVKEGAKYWRMNDRFAGKRIIQKNSHRNSSIACILLME